MAERVASWERDNRRVYHNILQELQMQDTENYSKYLRINVETFKFLLQKLRPVITKKTFAVRKPSSAEEQLGEAWDFLGFFVYSCIQGVSFYTNVTCFPNCVYVPSTPLRKISPQNFSKRKRFRWIFLCPLLQRPIVLHCVWYHRHCSSVLLSAFCSSC